MRKIYFLLVCFVFILAFFLRFNQLDKVPAGLEQDETSIGYNAYSILTTGKDEYGSSYPLYFKAFGEYKLPGYIYASVIPTRIFGVNEVGVRFISAFFGSLTIIVFFFLIRKLAGDKLYLPLVSAFFLCINPWHLFFSRGAFEVSPALFFIVSGTFFFIKSLDKNNKYLLFLSVLMLVASTYTYNVARIFSPILALVLVVTFRKQLISKPRLILYSSAVFSVLLLLPFIVSIFTKGGFSAVSGTVIFSSNAVLAPLLELRSYFINLPHSKIFFNNFTLLFLKYIENIISYFSVSFFFISGSTHGNHGIGNVGNLYLFEFPLVILGVITIFKDKLKWAYLFIIWFILTILLAAMTREVPQATRSFFLVVPLEIFSAIGFVYIYKFFVNIKKTRAKIFLTVLFVFMLYNIFYYFVSYYVRFPIAYAKEWRLGDKEVVQYLKENQDKYDKIILDTDSGFIYTSLLFYLSYSPSDFQNTVIREIDDSEGFSRVKSFGRYEFRNIDWSRDLKNKRTLIVTAPNRKPENVSPLAIFQYPTRPIVISVKEKIMQYPLSEVSYVLVTSQ